MKKSKKPISIMFQIVTAVLSVVVLTCCSKKEATLNTDGYVWTVPDMSGYENLDQSNAGIFRQIDLKQLETILDQKVSVLLFISSPQCGVCQEVIGELASKAKELDRTLCYINATDIASDYESYSRFLEIMSPVLVEEEGKKKIFTPELVRIENGRLIDHCVGSDLNGFIEILERGTE